MIEAVGNSFYSFNPTSSYSSLQRFGSTNSIFETAKEEKSELEVLQSELENVENEQGLFSGIYNGVKEITGLGTSSAKCEDAIAKYKNGELSFEEALNEIENYDKKQDNGLNLLANIATGFAAIGAVAAATAASVISGGILAPAAIGFAAGAITKAGIKTIDRATNKVEDDALDGKTIVKDALSGGITGATAALTMGTGKAAGTISKSVINGAKSSARTGLITGSVAGGSNYILDCAFDDEKDFDFGEFAVNTAINGAVSGTVGAIVGGAAGGLKQAGIVNAGGKAAIVNGKSQNCEVIDVIANGSNSAAHKVTNRMIKDVTNLS